MTTPIADAALLAAGADPTSAISPKELELGPAWLDLRGVARLVAIARAGKVGNALSACLDLQGESHLLVSADVDCAEAVAQRIAASLLSFELRDVLLAVVRGENIVTRLEELMAAGVDLRDNHPPYKSLRDERRQLVSAVAAAPPSVIRDAIEAGAKVAISRTADRRAVESAVDPGCIMEGSSTEKARKIALRFHNRYEVTAAFDDDRPIDQLASMLEERLPEGVEYWLREAQAVKIVRLSAVDRTVFSVACHRCNLLLEGLPTRIGDLSRRILDEWTVDVPAEHFQFGYDLRPASEWLGG